MKSKYLIALLAIYLISPSSYSDESSKTGYTIGFFNGVQNTYKEANNNLKLLKHTHGKFFNGEPINYALFYNESNAGMADFVEVFEQRTLELIEFRQWEVFWDVLQGKKSGGFIDYLTSIFTGFGELLDNLYSILANKTLANYLKTIVNTPPLEETEQQHQALAASLAWQGKKQLWVAHSQGNLFANQAYNYLIEREGVNKENIKLIHVAPASPSVNGEYILSSKDMVIKGLIGTGFNSVPSANVNNPFRVTSPLGHGFALYLDYNMPSRQKIFWSIKRGLESLEAPEVNSGPFTLEYKANEAFFEYYEKKIIGIVDEADALDHEYDLCDLPESHLEYCDDWGGFELRYIDIDFEPPMLHMVLEANLRTITNPKKYKFLLSDVGPYDKPEFIITFNENLTLKENKRKATIIHKQHSQLVAILQEPTPNNEVISSPPYKNDIAIYDNFKRELVKINNDRTDPHPSAKWPDCEHHISYFRLNYDMGEWSDKQLEYLANNKLPVPAEQDADFYGEICIIDDVIATDSRWWLREHMKTRPKGYILTN